MSFDLFYSPCRPEGERVERKNPFSGEVQTTRPAKSLSPRDLEAVREVLERVDAIGPDESGCYVARFRDGGEAEIRGGDDLGRGCMIASSGALTPGLLRFFFDLLRAADWIMLPAMEGNPAITALPGRAAGFADRYPEVVCRSAEELGALLTPGFERWTRFRDQIVDK